MPSAPFSRPDAIAADQEHYVALGDSFSSGFGAPPYEAPVEHRRSSNAFPVLLAGERHGARFDFEARIGADLAGVLAEQLGAVNADTTLVTITAGGNDIGFSARIGDCVNGNDADCVAIIRSCQRFGDVELPGRLDHVYSAIRERAPRAELIVVGYPHFFELLTEDAATAFTNTKRQVLNEVVDTLNQVTLERATIFDAAFVDVRDVFAGHGIGATDPWINDPAARGGFHPNAKGQRHGYLSAVSDRTGRRVRA